MASDGEHNTTQATLKDTIIFKGKETRSWLQLPPDIIKYIATFYLLDVQATNACPSTWEPREMWPSRTVYCTYRDAIELEKLMLICPPWHAALESHNFWRHACVVIDPHDVLKHHSIRSVPVPPTAGSNNASALQPIRLSPYVHFRNVAGCSCAVCRINAPYTNLGLASAKRMLATPTLGNIFTCRDHRKTTYCGVCLRDAPTLAPVPDGTPEYAHQQQLSVCCAENEDEETFPGVEATCRACRMEALWSAAGRTPGDREAIGGHTFASPDWETRQAVEGFLDLGEGAIRDVLGIAREKLWLRKNTKLQDMLLQAVAASKYSERAEAAGGEMAMAMQMSAADGGGGDGYASDEELMSGDEEEEEEEEEDTDLISMTEEAGGVRELAMSDWARNRILDGFWISPADQWYGNVMPNHPYTVPARHPCPYYPNATYDGALDDAEQAHGARGELEHPRPRTCSAPAPPSYQLCDHAFRAFQRQMREILFPALANVVRRLVIEGAADGTDPARRAARMTVSDVVEELREEAVWFNGIDWLERRANGEREERERLRREGKGKDEDDGSEGSSRSDGSHTTSPVLSTTTLQTTPSPPPSEAVKEEEDSAKTRVQVQMPIAVAPVLKSPKLLHPIPYIPVTVDHLPYYSTEAIQSVWREACAPLYQCRCSICERALLKANFEAGTVVSPQVQVQAQAQVEQVQQDPVPVYHVQVPERPVDLQVAELLADVHAAVREEEEEGESEKDDTDTSASEALPVTPRKRPSREREEEEGKARGGTPPKRARREGSVSPTPAPRATLPLPRLCKRSSEELEDESTAAGEDERAKRHKTARAVGSG